MNQKEVVLEPSSHPHILRGAIVETQVNGDNVSVEVDGKGEIIHGEHGTLITEKNFVNKFSQVEYNPMMEMYQKAFD